MFWGNTHNKTAPAFLYSVGSVNCELNSDHQPREKKKGACMLPACAYSTSDHTLMGWYLKGYWLNEFPQH